MKLLIYALALIVLTGSGCNSKTETKTEPPVIEKPAPEVTPTTPSETNHHDSNEGCHHEEGKCRHHGKKKRIPPGHAKKMHGEQSARNYAPGHSR